MPYTPDWKSLIRKETPEWLKDAKFGIYTHWGVYTVPGYIGCWYPHQMYRKGSPQYEHHKKTYGDPSVFGYKDFIPMFTAEKFDPDEWAEIFAASGAKFAGPVAEHHDGFAMWDTACSEWNAARMGPRRDIVAALEKSYRARGMKFMAALHHIENWFFYPHWVKEYDTSDPRYAGLYGDSHDAEGSPWLSESNFDLDSQAKPSQKALDTWFDKTKEVIDRFSPDLLWFDFGLRYVREDYRLNMLSYYYNQAEKKGQDVILTYKGNDMAAGSAMIDVELGGFNRLMYSDWITDTTLDDSGSWNWIRQMAYKTPEKLVQYLVNNVSRNGYLLLNVGPTPEGEIPAEAKYLLGEMGKWLAVNGEAIYGTRPWLYAEEGPTRAEKEGDFAEGKAERFTPADFRYTAAGSTIYAVALAWSDEYKLTRLKHLYPGEVSRVSMLGSPEKLEFRQTHDGLRVSAPQRKPGDYAWVFKIERRAR
ncbi:MAG: alpha-L-fucosidase [Treponema sp.]|jgi:alpha-L-fucosidase|nr:alpha-L-fucosidase [Treponema sp.]